MKNFKVYSLILLISIILIGIVFADHLITMPSGAASFEADEDIQIFYNISVNVTSNNVTQVNVTIPSSFTFTEASNGTDSEYLANFSNTDTVLTWHNLSILIDGTSGLNRTFWFNASAATPGQYNISVMVLNITGVSQANFTANINDTTPPHEINYTDIVDYGNYSGVIILNSSVLDNAELLAVTYNVTNATLEQNHTVIANNISDTHWNATLNTSSFPDGTYNITVWANDTFGNVNRTRTAIRVVFDNTATSASLTCTPSDVSTGATVTCSCGASDTTSGINTSATSFTTSPSTSETGTFSETCSITDLAGNSASSTATYSVTSSGSGPGSPGGSTVTTSFYKKTISKINEEFEDMKTIEQELKVKERVRIKIDDTIHYIGIRELEATSATVEIASDPVQIKLDINDDAKIDVNEDNFYDIYVKLNSITNGNADLTINYLHEEIPEEKDTAEGVETSGEIIESDITSSEGNLTWLWIVIGIVVVLIIAGAGYKYKKR